MSLEKLGINAVAAKREIAALSQNQKNTILLDVANALVKNKDSILKANKLDLEYADNNNITDALKDRLLLNEERIISMAEGLKQLVSLEDPIGKILEMNKRPNGLMIGKKVVPIGVIGIIYEARPNVTIDAFGLCFKTNNVVLLRGGKEAINSNLALVDVVRAVLSKNGVNPDGLQILEDTSRELANEMMKMNQYLDLLIPRGGAGLIQAVVNNATIPVIETGVGNCHIYIDKYANIKMAVSISVNAKIQRPGVCNSCETIVVHKDVAQEFLTELSSQFEGKVEVRGDDETCKYISYATKATKQDYHTEFHDFIISIKVVDTFIDAINHIDTYSTNHSEAIITESYERAQTFLDVVDSAAVYVNASTRFTDGFEFGFGAEIGISTQKLHARGPMGLQELTTTKYIIYGNGQVRT